MIGGRSYVVKGFARESRFGMDDPKYWVKRVVDSESGESKIIKLTFLESFEITLGGVKIKCFRSPDKEGKILELVQGHLSFMHGKAYIDEKGNNVRVLDLVSGPNFYTYIFHFKMIYKDYFYNVLPGILKNLVEAFEAVRFLHLNDYKHGDIRNDHIYFFGCKQGECILCIERKVRMVIGFEKSAFKRIEHHLIVINKENRLSHSVFL